MPGSVYWVGCVTTCCLAVLLLYICSLLTINFNYLCSCMAFLDRLFVKLHSMHLCFSPFSGMILCRTIIICIEQKLNFFLLFYEVYVYEVVYMQWMLSLENDEVHKYYMTDMNVQQLCTTLHANSYIFGRIIYNRLNITRSWSGVRALVQYMLAIVSWL